MASVSGQYGKARTITAYGSSVFFWALFPTAGALLWCVWDAVRPAKYGSTLSFGQRNISPQEAWHRDRMMRLEGASPFESRSAASVRDMGDSVQGEIDRVRASVRSRVEAENATQ